MSDESQIEADVESPEQPTEAAPTTSGADELATLKKRLAGKDQAYTKLKDEAEALRAEREALSRWKAEREEADLTEVEKLQRKLAEAEERAQAIEAEKERIRLESKYPLAVEFYGDDPLPSEERLAALQDRLGTTTTTVAEDDDVDPNTPPARASTPPSGKEPTIDDLRLRLRKELAGATSLADVRGW